MEQRSFDDIFREVSAISDYRQGRGFVSPGDGNTIASVVIVNPKVINELAECAENSGVQLKYTSDDQGNRVIDVVAS